MFYGLSLRKEKTMKKQLLLSACAIAAITLGAQSIPNSGFETWINNTETFQTYSVPQNWITIDVIQTAFSGDSSFVLHSVVPSSTPHSGTSAVRMQTGISTNGDTMGGIIYSVNSFADLTPLLYGTGVPGFTINARPANLNGYYRMNVSAGDTGLCAMILCHWNTSTQTRDTLYYTESLAFPGNQSTWTSFSFPISYSSSATPDTCLIAFGLISQSSATNINSFLEVDDLAFSGIVPIGINEQSFVSGGNFYPNPMTDHAEIRIEGAPLDNANLEIYDLSGKLVRTDAGINGNVIAFERLALASGTYMYRVVQDGNVTTQGKMVITE